MPRISVVAIFIGVVGFLSCAPVSYHFKEKETQVSTIPRLAMQVDRFVYDKPFGPLDFLFIVDNTDSFDVALEAEGDAEPQLKTDYDRFVRNWKANPEVRQVDDRIALISTPYGDEPAFQVVPDKPFELHLASLFDYNPVSLDSLPLLSPRNLREVGQPRPFRSFLKLLGSAWMANRAMKPAFVIFFLGADKHPDDELVSEDNEEEGLIVGREDRELSIRVLSRRSDATADSFPRCSYFRKTPSFEASLETIRPRVQSLEYYDLCDAEWNNWPDLISAQAIEAKKRLFLSQVPYRPESMTVRVANRLFRFGEHYEFRSNENEIVFYESVDIQSSDLVEVTYFTAPAQSDVPGGDFVPPPIQ